MLPSCRCSGTCVNDDVPRSGSLHYGRHFGLLGGAVLVLALGGHWRPQAAVPSLALYGAVHSTIIAASLRAAPALWRKAVFIALAAGLCTLSGRASLHASRFMTMLPAAGRPYLQLAVYSGIGALGYALLVRRFWIGNLPYRAMPAMALTCMGATLAALIGLSCLRTMGSLWWLAGVWWLAFSAGLWYFDTRIEAI